MADPSPRPLKIFFCAGEPSGDLHAANLIRQLKAQYGQLEAVGYGGPQMEAAGCQLYANLTQLAVMWFLRVLANLHKFWDLLSRADRYFRHQRPDAVVLVDYPGFNWWIARRAKAHGITVFYYAPPQIWAWARWRVKKMRRLVDHVLCALPFEQTWFADHGCNATFVGHPYFDEMRRQQFDQDFIRRCQRQPGPLVTILPGSRTQEVEANLEGFLQAAAYVRAKVPDVRFAVAAFKPPQADIVRRRVTAAKLPVDVHVGRTPELIRLADCCMAVSGSVSLELLYQTKPTVISYKISRPAFFVQSFFRKVKYITLVNLLAADDPFAEDLALYDPGQENAHQALFPEYLTWADKSAQIARHLVQWLTHPDARESLVAELARLKAAVTHGGASRCAAEYILTRLTAPSTAIPRPHFVQAGQPARGNEPSTVNVRR
jgi:lipid-A-disaccharide synthase